MVRDEDRVVPDKDVVRKFVERWEGPRGRERRHAQTFFNELCRFLEVPGPDEDLKDDDYCFERDVKIQHPDGKTTTGQMDFYNKHHFIIEAKHGSEKGDAALGTARRGTPAWDRAMRGAFGQVRQYAAHLPEGQPPFLLTCDIGFVFEVWSGFDGAYGGYGARRTIRMADLENADVFDFLRRIFIDPASLDPLIYQAAVTQEVAEHLADLARALEKDGRDPEAVAQFLMRCLFTMFAEDVGLLPTNLFTNALKDRWIPDPSKFPHELDHLWQAMDEGLPFGFEAKLPRFNGRLFAFRDPPHLNAKQLGLLLEAAKCDWSSVEPAIFGTLVERALEPKERHRLGAHYTPREYIERLVRPTVIDPLRAEWDIIQAEVLQIKGEGETMTLGQRKSARDLLRGFHRKLCDLRILDPACGSGNFLYVTMDLLKGLEAEVLRELGEVGVKEAQGKQRLDLEDVMIHPGQFYGLEINPRAREIAELVLWIGYLQWYKRTYRDISPPEPILRDFKNIERRDAVLASDGSEVRVGEDGRPVTIWDMKTTKTDPITGKEVPDETAVVAIMDPRNPRYAEWPEADFIVSNPPFIGNKRMREELGDGYTEALRKTWKDVPNSADYVMYWWDRCAELVRSGKVKRFGLITTNSITQAFNRKIVSRHLEAKTNRLALAWAVADHPWVIDGAAVRIAMTVGAHAGKLMTPPEIGRVELEGNLEDSTRRARSVTLSTRRVPKIFMDLSGAADLAGAVELRANKGVAFTGMYPLGQGFVLSPDELKKASGTDPSADRVMRSFVTASDITRTSRSVKVIDFYPMGEVEVKREFPCLYEWIFERVKPQRDRDKRESRRINWWLFAEPVPALRHATAELRNFILVPRTAKHFTYQFFSVDTVPDTSVVAIANEDPFILGVLSSSIHRVWSVEAGGRLGVGNDTRYQHKRTFNPFPFPEDSEVHVADIRDVANRLDAHRKAVLQNHYDLYLTAQYNALARRREAEAGGPPLTPKERDIQERAQTGVLQRVHDELDRAVADAYGWPHDLDDEEILERLVELNAERAAEEAAGYVRYLRPEIQDPKHKERAKELLPKIPTKVKVVAVGEKPQWPKDTAAQLAAVRNLLVSGGAWSVEDVAASFKSAHRRTAERHLETLEALGVLQSHDLDGRRWSALSVAV